MPANATLGMRTFHTMFQLAVPQLPAGPIITPSTNAPANNSVAAGNHHAPLGRTGAAGSRDDPAAS